MLGLIGKKLGMSSVYDENGNSIPVTIIEAGPCVITQIKSRDTDGYSAVQLGFGKKKEKNTVKPSQGHFKKAKVNGGLFPAIVKEFKDFALADVELGSKVGIDIFQEGDVVSVTGISKGKGFQGVMKRHGFGGVGGTSHGQSDRLRAPGSIGQSSYPSRVFKGMKMAGKTGQKAVTIKNLRVVKIIPDSNIMFVKGAIPGKRDSYIQIKKD